MKNRSSFYSRTELFRLLEEADLPEEEKAKIEPLLKYAVTGKQTARKLRLRNVIGDYLVDNQPAVPKFPEGEGMPEFFTGSHSLVVGAPGTGKTFLVMASLARIYTEE